MNKYLSNYSSVSRLFPALNWHVNAKLAKTTLNPGSDFISRFPNTAQLIAASHAFTLSYSSRTYLMVAWDCQKGDSIGWICLWPNTSTPTLVCEAHGLFLSTLGGIVDHWGSGFDNILDNQRFLGATGLQSTVDGEIPASCTDAGLCNEDDGQITILTEEYNGNCSFYLYPEEKIYYYAPDHCDSSLVPAGNGQSGALYVRADTPDFTSLIEKLACQWKAKLGK